MLRLLISSVIIFFWSCAVFRPWYYDSKFPMAKSAYIGSNGKPSKDVVTLGKTIGLQKASIIEVFGAPNRTVSDGNGGEIVVYEVEQETTNFRGTFFKEFYFNNDKVVRFKFGYRQ